MARLRTSRLAWLAFMTLLRPAGARAQAALTSALQLDQTLATNRLLTNTNAPLGLGPAGHYWGPVPFTLGAYASATFDDNVSETQTSPESDFILGAGVNLASFWAPTGQSQLQLGTGLGYVWYLRNTRDGGLNVNPDSALTYSISIREVTFTVFDQFSYTREVVSLGPLANIGVLPQLDNTIGTRLAWNPGNWTFQTGYSHDDYFSDGAGQDLNRSSEYLFGRGGWRFAENTDAGLEVSDTVTANEDPTLGNSSTFSAGVYADWQLRQSLKLTVRGGPSLSTFSSGEQTAGNSTLLSYYAELDISEQLTDYLSQRLSLNRSIQPGLNGGSAYVEQLTGTYSITWSLTQFLNLTGTFTYDNGSQPLPTYLPGGFVMNSIEHYNLYGIQPQISWRLTDKLSTSVTYSHWLRDSDMDGRSYHENSVSWNVTYTF